MFLTLLVAAHACPSTFPVAISPTLGEIATGTAEKGDKHIQKIKKQKKNEESSYTERKKEKQKHCTGKKEYIKRDNKEEQRP
jgi:hypothetical protein